MHATMQHACTNLAGVARNIVIIIKIIISFDLASLMFTRYCDCNRCGIVHVSYRLGLIVDHGIMHARSSLVCVYALVQHLLRHSALA